MNKTLLLAGTILFGSMGVMAGCDGGGGNGEVGGGGSDDGAGGSSGGDGSDGGGWVPCDHEIVPPTPVKAAWSKSIRDPRPTVAEVEGAGVAALPDGGIATAYRDDSVNWGCHIAKLDTAGNEVWATVISGGRLMCDAIAADAAGNVYVAGSFEGQIDGTSVVPSFDDAAVWSQENDGKGATDSDVGDLYIVKLDGAGVVQFLHNFGSAGTDYYARLSVAPDGTSVLTGYFGGGVSFGLVKQGTKNDLHAVGLSPDGAVLWTGLIEAGPDGGRLEPEALASGPNGEVYLAANKRGLDSLLLARLDGGATIWRRDYQAGWPEAYPNSGPITVTPRLAIGTDGNLILAGQMVGGSYEAPIDFGAGAVTGPGYVTAISPAGDALWSFGFRAYSTAVAIEPNGSIHLVGRANEDLLVGVPPVAVAAASGDMVTARLGQDGAFLSATVEISSDPAPHPIAMTTTAAGTDVIMGFQGYDTSCGMDFGQGELPRGGIIVSVQP